MRGLLLFPAALLGGVMVSTVVWVGILFSQYRQWMVPGRAVAGGWTYLLNSFWVVVLLTLGFGVGFYLVTLLSRRI
jgi:hypothetical protein